ncbi:MAG TPA: hypothetical protein VJM33_15820 [Microthrixaceae bacterium]|nr:hypothetical protein [Microthrixaceae bacterium]
MGKHGKMTGGSVALSAAGGMVLAACAPTAPPTTHYICSDK